MARRVEINAALEIGKQMAEDAIKRRRRAARKRKAALAKIEVHTMSTIVSGPARFIASARTTHDSAGVLIAEGDSWFDYPLYDVLNDLEDNYGFDVHSVAHRGDTVEEMAYSDGQLDDFSRLAEKTLQTGVKPRAILLSGGGNDVAGDPFAMLLNHARSNISGLNKSVVTGVLEERVRNAYATILNAITEVCKAHSGSPIPIIVHGYDYPVPDGRGFLGGFGPLPGPWLDPGFRQKGYGSMNLRIQICADLIDQFNAMLKSLAGQAPFKHVHYLDLRETLSTGKDYKKFWGNELHPTATGFELVTAKFADLISKI